MGFFTGKKEKFEQRSRLSPGQQPLLNEYTGAAGGGFNSLADYYKNLMSDNPEDFQAFAAPEMRRFNQEIIPGLAEQFAGMGSGALNSSGFRNAAVNAGADLSERLANLRARLRSQGAQGLQQFNQGAISPNYYENVYRPRQQGFLEAMAPGIGAGLGMAAFGGFGGAPSMFGPKPQNNTNPNG